MRGAIGVSIAGLLAALVTLAPARAQQPTFSTRVEAIRVDVLVADRADRPVPGLHVADFEVRDNGVVQQVDFASFEQLPLTVVLALDMSRSVAGERLDHLRASGAALVKALKPEDRVALVTFSHAVALRAPLTGDFARVQQALATVRGAGDTALIDGTYAAMTMGRSAGGRSLLIVFSDGLDTSSWLTANAVLDAAKRADVVAYAVSAGGEKQPFLDRLCEATGGRAFQMESTSNLDAAFLRILDEFRHRYLLSYSPRGVERGGWHRLDVKVKGRRVTVKARPGYLGAQ